MEQRTSKNVFQLGGGLNTEINELNFPDGYTTDEANYEILQDGSRRRRKGLAAESSQGSAKDTITFTTSGSQQCYLWKNVGGNPSKDVVVYKQQDLLFFADADETMSGAWQTGEGSYVELDQFASGGATTAKLDDQPVSFSHGRGRLLVTGQYIRPFYVEYDETNDEYVAYAIRLRVRDFGDIEDTTTVGEEPTGTITADHRYNLRNRGWKQADMDTYNSGLSKHPAKNARWYKGYKRVDTTTGVDPRDGTHQWSNAKLDAEAFGNSSAPRGSLFIEPFDSTFGYGIAGDTSNIVDISTWTFVDNGDNWTVTITTGSAHGLSSGDVFTIENNSMYYNYEFYPGVPGHAVTSFDGEHAAITGTTGSTLVFTWSDSPSTWTAWENQYRSKGKVNTSTSLARSNGTAHDDSVRAVEFFAGRAFYAGAKNTEWADTIFFSQIVDTAEKFARCYQEADPTDEEFNAIVSTDGGHIVIPGLSGVIEMKALRNTLLIFSTEGVWELSGGQGVFTADSYSVRKITDAACSSSTSIVVIESSVIFTGPGGIYIIAPNQYTGILEATNAIEQTIQTKWNSFTVAEQERCQAFYDDAQKRAYFMLGPDGTAIAVDEMLVFDSKIAAWFRYTFDTPSDNVLLTGVAIPDADAPSTNKKAKFLYEASTSSVNWADFDQTSFDDWDGTNGPLPYIYTSWDNLGDFQRRRQAPIITVYSQRTETGFTEAGGQYTAANPSSTLMSGYWDWVSDATNETTTNKITATQEIYRKVRDFAPGATTDLDGYPVVVTRNKLRGRGRVLQLKFEGAEDKDSHILGFTTNYKISRRV